MRNERLRRLVRTLQMACDPDCVGWQKSGHLGEEGGIAAVTRRVFGAVDAPTIIDRCVAYPPPANRLAHSLPTLSWNPCRGIAMTARAGESTYSNNVLGRFAASCQLTGFGRARHGTRADRIKLGSQSDSMCCVKLL